MSSPLVSVIIPVFNSEDTIEKTLQSILAQEYHNWEAICVDDGSTDNSVKLISKFSKNDGRIKLQIRAVEPKGGSTCRNIGAFESIGEYLIFLDADDLLAPTCIANRVESIEGSKNQFVVFPMASFINNDLSTKRLYSRMKVRDYKYFFVTGFGAWQVTSPIFKRAFFKSLGGFNTAFPRLQDVEFHLRAIVHSNGEFEVMRKAAPDCYYRLSKQNSIVVEKLKRSVSGFDMYVELLKELSMQGAFPKKKVLSSSLLSLYCHWGVYVDRIKTFDNLCTFRNPLEYSS
jgi:glycosyltransferase involved in cell wall biosynthesis